MIVAHHPGTKADQQNQNWFMIHLPKRLDVELQTDLGSLIEIFIGSDQGIDERSKKKMAHNRPCNSLELDFTMSHSNACSSRTVVKLIVKLKIRNSVRFAVYGTYVYGVEGLETHCSHMASKIAECSTD